MIHLSSSHSTLRSRSNQRTAARSSILRRQAARLARLLVLAMLMPVLLGAQKPEDRTVSVLYAGSLATVMENGIGPTFTKATGYSYQGEAQGSLGAAQMIRDHL